MEDIFSIGEVSKLLDVPAATIRFWEQEGLLSPRKEANRYRAYGPRELAEIADVVFLRSTGVPVKRILQMRSFDLEQYQDGLNQLEDYAFTSGNLSADLRTDPEADGQHP